MSKTLILLGEYRSQNSNRRYPFIDDATLTDTLGNVLPLDLILDAYLFPIDVTGQVYLQSIDTATSKFYFATSTNSTPFGVATYTGVSDTIYVYETGAYARQIGVLVVGPGTNAILGGTIVRSFTMDATALCPSTYILMNQPGVRGILLDDGTLMTGDIVLEGGPGVEITTYGYGNEGWINFDFIGTLPPTSDDCGNPNPLIRQICFVRQPNSMFSIAPYGTGISLSGFGFDQTGLCQAQRSVALPDTTGALPPQAVQDTPCTPQPPPNPPDPGPVQNPPCIAAAGLPGGTLVLVTPSSGAMLNPISLKAVQGVLGPSSLNQVKPLDSISELDSQLKRFTNPPTSTDALRIGIRGLSGFKGATS